jgi:hypothetical protein
MALPQTVDPTSLNLSGKPAIATAPATTTTTPASVGMPGPRIEDVSHEVNPLLGGLFSGLLAYASSNKGNKTGTGTGTGTGAGTGSNSGIGNTIGNIIKGITGGSGSGNIGSVNNVIVPPNIPISEAQAWLDTQYGKTNGQSNYIASGTNLSTGSVVGLPNDKIGGSNLGTNTGNFGNTADGTTGAGSTDTSNLTNIGGGYFTDDSSNIYDSNGNLIYQNPGATTGTQTETGGGGWDAALDEYYQNSYGDVYDGTGNLVLSYNNGYYYEPDTGNFYDNNFDPVSTDFNAYSDYFNVPTFDSSNTDLGNIDWSGYGTDWTSTWVKDGGSINKNGLPTPLFANGGNVKRFADGGTSFTDQVVANQMPATTSTPTTTSNTGGSTGGVLDSILNFASSNPTLTGAGLGALLTAMLNQSTSIPTNKGVDMTALGTLKPRTTPTGPAKFVPYSEYGTPTTPADYSALYQNLGVSPFSTPAPTTAPTAPATTPTMPATAPSGGLPTTTPTGTTPVAPSMPSYFSDADGNIYDANGDLVYDVTSGSMTASTGATATPTSSTPAAPLATGTLAPTGAGDAYYSYGTPVTPSSVLGAKKGGLAVKKMADGGAPAYYSGTDVLEGDFSPYYKNLIGQYDPTGELGLTQQKLIQALQQSYPNMNQYEIDALVATHPDRAFSMYKDQLAQNNFARDYALKGTTSGPTDDPLATLYDSVGSSMDPSQYDYYYEPTATYNLQGLDITGQQIQDYFTQQKNNPLPYERNDVSVTSTGTDLPPVMYNQGMPQQGNLMPPQNQPAMPTQGPAMPTQGSAMPQQTPFSSSPTFKYSGANNPLLTGLRQPTPGQQPFMLMPDGTFAPREEISTSRQYADGGYVPPPSFMSARDQLAYSSSMRDPSIPYSSGVVSTPGTVARGGYRPPSARPVTPTMPAQNNNYLNSQYLNTWQKSFPGYRAPALDGRGTIGGPFQIYGRPFAEGGDIGGNIPIQTNPNIPQINGRNDYREGGNYVEGPGDGQSDDIPAMLADGEYVIDAETVAQLGNGSNKAGAKILDEFRENIRSHKRSAPTHKIPPKSKSALAYLKGAK